MMNNLNFKTHVRKSIKKIFSLKVKGLLFFQNKPFLRTMNQFFYLLEFLYIYIQAFCTL